MTKQKLDLHFENLVNKTELGKRIMLLRKSNGLSQASFAEPLGISRVTVSQVENGDVTPSIELVAKIVKMTNSSFDYLIWGAESNKTQLDISDKSEVTVLATRIKDLEETIEALKASNQDKERIINFYEDSNKM